MLKTPKKEFYTRYTVLSFIRNLKTLIEIGKVEECKELMETMIKELKD